MSDLVRIGVFYDGNFLFHISNYYYYHHANKARISIGGMHSYLRRAVSNETGADESLCQVVEVHYFRGRPMASETNKDSIFKERMFEDVLVREGVITHYLPVSNGNEKGVDIQFVLEAYEAAVLRKLDVIVLVASDGGFVPLVRKLSAAGAKTMLIGCDFTFMDENGSERTTRTSQRLVDEVSYPILLNEVLSDPRELENGIEEMMFVKKRNQGSSFGSHKSVKMELKGGVDGKYLGTVQNVLDGYGFITPLDPASGRKNIFFHFNDVSLEDSDDDVPRIGDRVQFEIGSNEKGPCAKNVILVDIEGEGDDIIDDVNS